MTADGRPAIGFVGVGSMGGAIAGNLLRAGMSLAVLDPASQRVAALVAEGAREAASLADLAEAEIVCLSLPGPAEVEAVVLGDGGLLGHMRPGALLMCFSTISLDSCRKLDAAARSSDVAFVDAPVTGAADGARDASLVLMVGASADAFVLASPIFEVIGRRALLVGKPPAGTAAKLLTNMLWFVHVIALSEALAIGSGAGVAPELLGEVVRQSAGASWVAQHDLDNLLSGDDDESFSLALCCKDLRLIGELGREVGYESSLAPVAAAWFERARDSYGPAAGELAVSRLIEMAAGVSIRLPVRPSST